MSKLEPTVKHIKSTKIENKKLEKLAHCFVNDFTASQTAQTVNLSRQTINSYYKTIRDSLIKQQKISDNLFFDKINLCKKPLFLKYCLINNKIIYFLEYSGKIFFLEDNIFILEEELKNSLKNHKRANCAKLLYNTYEKKYFISSFSKDSNSFETFLNTRLKKFRGINKNNFKIHIKETIFRYNCNKNFLFTNLQIFFNL